MFPKHLIVDGHIPLPSKVSELNNFTCGNLHRDLSFPLCCRCANGTGPATYYFGSKCVPCSAVNILYYLLLQYLPNTIMFLAIIVFRINITAAPMVHYVLFCNFVMLTYGFFSGEYSNIVLSLDHKNTYIKYIGRLSLTQNAVWTFDILLFLSPPLCISEHMQEIYIPYLNTLAALYPFILLLITYAAIQLHAHDYKLVVRLWKLFHRTYVRFRSPGTRPLHIILFPLPIILFSNSQNDPLLFLYNSFLCTLFFFFLHMSETVGERRRSKRDEHDERSDSLDVAVAEVDEATLPSLPLPLPLASPSIDYCRVRVIVSTCVRHAQCVCSRRTHGPAPFLQHFNPLFPNYSFL